MTKLTEETRKIFRAIFRGVGAVTASLSLSACPLFFSIDEPSAYGMPPDIVKEEILIRGVVRNKKTGIHISNIAVYIETDNLYFLTRTNNSGSFYNYVPVNGSYTFLFTDVDGDRNGRLKQRKINLTKEEAQALAETPLVIEMEEETNINEE